MTASMTFLSIMVTGALIITAMAPILLLVLLIRDWLRGELW